MFSEKCVIRQNRQQNDQITALNAEWRETGSDATRAKLHKLE